MQGYNSTEREFRYLQPNLNTIKVEKYNDEEIITSCYSSNSLYSYFCKTTLGSSNVVYAQLPQRLEVFDFKICDDNVIMCGKRILPNANIGFIAKIKVSDLFAGTGQLEIHEVQSERVVYKLECYSYNNSIRVAALSYDSHIYSFIDYDIGNLSTPYYKYSSDYTLYDITQTNHYISIVFSERGANYFGIMRHDKANISNNTGVIWSFPGYAHIYSTIERRPENRETYFLIENIDNTDNVCIATEIEGATGTFGAVDIGVYDIYLGNFTTNQSQLLLTAGKLKLKDIEYCDYNQALHIIDNTDLVTSLNGVGTDIYSTDVIHEVKVYPNMFPYSTDVVLPNNNLMYGEYNNSIISYDDEYYIVAGLKNQTNNLFWFDRKYTSGSTPTCYARYKTTIKATTINPINTYLYQSLSNQKTMTVESCNVSTGVLIIYCSD